MGIRENEKLGKSIEPKLLSMYTDAKLSNPGDSWDIETPFMLVEVKSTHQSKANGHKSTRLGAFIINKQSHINLLEASKQRSKHPRYHFVLLDGKNEIIDQTLRPWQEIEQLFKKINPSLRKAGRFTNYGETTYYTIPYKLIFNETSFAGEETK